MTFSLAGVDYVATTDGDHDLPVFRNLAREIMPAAQLLVADITYIAIPAGFAYVAFILNAWSRKVAGYAIAPVDRRAADAGGAASGHREAGAREIPMTQRRRAS